MTYTKAKGTFINPGSSDNGDPRWFILGSSDQMRAYVYESKSQRDDDWNRVGPYSGSLNPRSWYTIEEENMSEFKVGDRVKVEFEGEVMMAREAWVEVKSDKSKDTVDVYFEDAHVTKVAPKLPTKVGSVVDSCGYRFILTDRGWHATSDVRPYGSGVFESSIYAKDFTVVLEGK